MPPTILIVTNQVLTSVWFKKHLKASYHCILESSETSALERIKSTSVEVIIIDGRLQGIPIVSFLLQLKKTIGAHWIPILLISDNLKKAFRSRMTKAGVFDFLSDPLNDEEVHQALISCLKAKERQKKIGGISDLLKKNRKAGSEAAFTGKIFLDPKAMKLIANSKEKHKPLSFAFFKIDKFEELAKKHTPLKIEKILLYLSDIILQLSGASDILVPAKEGKFLLIMPDVNPEMAKERARQIQEKLKQKPYKDTSGLLPISISIALVKEDLPFEEISAMADQALKKIEKTSQIISLRHGVSQ